jgi:hypothetical protein
MPKYSGLEMRSVETGPGPSEPASMQKQIPGRSRHPLYKLLHIFNFNAAHHSNPLTKSPGKNRCFDALVYFLFSSQLILPLPNLAVPEEFEADVAFQLPGAVD